GDYIYYHVTPTGFGRLIGYAYSYHAVTPAGIGKIGGILTFRHMRVGRRIEVGCYECSNNYYLFTRHRMRLPTRGDKPSPPRKQFTRCGNIYPEYTRLQTDISGCIRFSYVCASALVWHSSYSQQSR